MDNDDKKKKPALPLKPIAPKAVPPKQVTKKQNRPSDIPVDMTTVNKKTQKMVPPKDASKKFEKPSDKPVDMTTVRKETQKLVQKEPPPSAVRFTPPPVKPSVLPANVEQKVEEKALVEIKTQFDDRCDKLKTKWSLWPSTEDLVPQANTELYNENVIVFKKAEKSFSEVDSELQKVTKKSLELQQRLQILPTTIRDEQKQIDELTKTAKQLYDTTVYPLDKQFHADYVYLLHVTDALKALDPENKQKFLKMPFDYKTTPIEELVANQDKYYDELEIYATALEDKKESIKVKQEQEQKIQEFLKEHKDNPNAKKLLEEKLSQYKQQKEDYERKSKKINEKISEIRKLFSETGLASYASQLPTLEHEKDVLLKEFKLKDDPICQLYQKEDALNQQQKLMNNVLEKLKIAKAKLKPLQKDLLEQTRKARKPLTKMHTQLDELKKSHEMHKEEQNSAGVEILKLELETQKLEIERAKKAMELNVALQIIEHFYNAVPQSNRASLEPLPNEETQKAIKRLIKETEEPGKKSKGKLNK